MFYIIRPFCESETAHEQNIFSLHPHRRLVTLGGGLLCRGFLWPAGLSSFTLAGHEFSGRQKNESLAGRARLEIW